MATETKVIYHIDEQETPYLVKLNQNPDEVKLRDLKEALNRPNYKFFFKSMDEDFGVVKEEVTSDEASLPCVNGRVVAWLVSGDSSSEKGSDKVVKTDSRSHEEVELESSRNRQGGHRRRDARNQRDGRRYRDQASVYTDESCSIYTTETENSSYLDSADDATSCYTSDTYMTSSTHTGHSHHSSRRHGRRRHHHSMHRAPSYSSVSSSTMSMPIVTIHLSMEKTKFLGISIVGQANRTGDGGIYVGSVMKGGAVAEDGTIQAGDMILQVGDVSFENMSNDDAVRVLRETVHKPGPLKLIVAKCWDPDPQPFFEPRTDPIRPIDPSAWVQHTQLARQDLLHPMGNSPTMSSMTTSSSSFSNSLPESDRGMDYTGPKLPESTPAPVVVQKMSLPESGLEVRDRLWLKMTIPKAFTGSDVVDWLYKRVEGFKERREARKYASQLLKMGLIKHTVNKITFSEQCYYIFGDIPTNSMAGLRLNEEGETDTLGPLPGAMPWGMSAPVGPVGNAVPPGRYQLPQYLAYTTNGSQPQGTYSSASRAYSQTTSGSGSGSSHSADDKNKKKGKDKRSFLPESDQLSQYTNDTLTDTASIISSLVIPRQFQKEGSIISGRESVREAGENPCELFVDVM
ncbi:segment polarity protein dishevelled homolog DVL-3-like [Corticium candelabrum]|uniref:segment polarity protein dishevelled homolog DVL-3-like n=1 Tax=Corticium candelabrum TaxID=121492 RepID=UPI002E26C02C|nr:segment polarity protein dishevelled homolog DVL-3-like [Corticium candelabrum]